MTEAEAIFWKNARGILRDIGMAHLDRAHGAAVDIVRWCLLVRGRPTHHRQTFLETESPALLAYLEKLATSGDAAGWRTLEERVRFRAGLLQDSDMQPCPRPWLAAIWHALPELAGLGQVILDRQTENDSPAPDAAPVVSDTTDGTAGEGDKGTAGKAGSTTSARPRPSPRLALPVVPVTPTEAEIKALDLDDDTPADVGTKMTPEGPDGTDGPGGMKGPGGKR
jgi:hypothetical protein